MEKQVICLDTYVLIDYFRKENKKIDKPDIMIAGTAIANNLKLATLNTKHFERISGLDLIKRK